MCGTSGGCGVQSRRIGAACFWEDSHSCSWTVWHYSGSGFANLFSLSGDFPRGRPPKISGFLVSVQSLAGVLPEWQWNILHCLSSFRSHKHFCFRAGFNYKKGTDKIKEHDASITLPVTSASSERSFSALQRIKTYLRQLCPVSEPMTWLCWLSTRSTRSRRKLSLTDSWRKSKFTPCASATTIGGTINYVSVEYSASKGIGGVTGGN